MSAEKPLRASASSCAKRIVGTADCELSAQKAEEAIFTVSLS
jgi:hypothetical protein